MITYLKNYEEKIKLLGYHLRNKRLPRLSKELFAIYEETGSRTEYEKVYFERRKFLCIFAMLGILYKRKEDMDKLEYIIEEICAEETWALPAHVDRKGNLNWRHTLDLFSCETAQALAEITNLLKENLSDEIYFKAKEEVLKRVLLPFALTDKKDAPWWEHCEMNWCAVCNGSIGSAAIYYVKELPEVLEKIIERVSSSIWHYLDGFSDDGVCYEGIYYYSYGMLYYTGFARQLYTYSGQKIDLMNHEKVKKIALFQQKCYFPDASTLSFSDGSSHDSYRMGLTAYLAASYEKAGSLPPECAGGFEADSCYRWMGVYRDYFWTKEFQAVLLEKAKKKIDYGIQYTFLSAQWSICHSKNRIGLACKGGNNDEPHNHNDIGCLQLMAGGEMLLADLGAGEYVKNSFNKNRYQIFGNSSFSHCVPIINEKGQKEGKGHCCQCFQTDGNGHTEIEFAKAYEQGEIKEIHRTIDFDLENGSLSICDLFERTDKTKSITENLVVLYPPQINGNLAVFQTEKQIVSIIIEEPLNLRIDKRIHKNHEGLAVTIYCILWDVNKLGKVDIRIQDIKR
ncbi:heparinase II/III-like protein [Lachnotalea glycerini]|uniref:Heparinase II/III-like protein n=1 Tax=Lachnotalea glycerini TaxID=1763509 RepID=A0A318EM32_9FIRM|nr:heparinase II/III family protein [Lachnotalea glycerini]PXV85060.1 heparinase II/III-like protein [Lachnotalea glycerini]